MVHGSRLSDEKCDPAGGETTLNCEPDNLSYDIYLTKESDLCYYLS